MTKISIAFLQLAAGKSLDEQYKIGIYACKEAKKMGADIALFPEMWSDGYCLPQESDKLSSLAITQKSDFILGFKSLAAQLNMAIGITFLEKNDPKPLNSMILFDRHGENILHYSKVHTCDFADEKVLSSGKEFFVADLDTEKGGVAVGCMICFDREFPESARLLMLKGAELILAPNACPMEINRLSALRTRAYENMLAIATCNYPEDQPDCNGRSTLFDGVAWTQFDDEPCSDDEPESRDMCVFKAPKQAGVYVAELDLDLLRYYREHEIMGNKYRHPDRYGDLVR